MYQGRVYIGDVDVDRGDDEPGFESLGSGILRRAEVVTLLGRHSSGSIDDLSLPRDAVRRALQVTWQRTNFEQLPEALAERVAREAMGSDLAVGTEQTGSDLAVGAEPRVGETPDTWSPLGELRHDSFGRLEAFSRLGLIDDEDAPLRLADGFQQGSPVVVFRAGGEDVAVLSYHPDSFVVAVSAEALRLTIRSEGEDEEANVAWSQLRELVGGARRDVMVWRVYSGENSWIRDIVTTSVSGVHSLALVGLEGAAFVVGRAVRVRARRLDGAGGDPFHKRNRRRAEARDPQTSAACPGLNTSPKPVDRAVVVVHGTMSNGMALARAAKSWLPAGTPIRRFEHDTWASLKTNAHELASLIVEEVQDEVCLLAHSRGGLVASRAAILLNKSAGVSVRDVITLGTPFEGTPMAVGAEVGFMGVRALMGGLRFAGGPTVDAVSRLAGLAIRTTVPPGLRLMYPDSDTLELLREALPANLRPVAASTDPQRAYYGLGVAKRGVGNGVFAGQPNDLVVGQASALASLSGTRLHCDHYSYLEQRPVRDLVQAAGRRLGAAPTLTW